MFLNQIENIYIISHICKFLIHEIFGIQGDFKAFLVKLSYKLFESLHRTDIKAVVIVGRNYIGLLNQCTDWE